MMEIQIYTNSDCQYCAAAKRLLEKRQLPYTETALNDSKQQELREQTGQSTTPYIFVDGRHIGGFDELVELDQDGELVLSDT